MCRCLQALAEALKINASITEISLEQNDIVAEGAKASCGAGSAETSLNAAACHDLMSSIYFGTHEKFGCFGAVVSWFLLDRVELSANM